jgi:glutamate synthase (NADPH/NADH) large chain
MILATGAVHSHLVKQGLRTFCSITCARPNASTRITFAVLIGVGATCVNAYLAQDAITDRHARGLFGDCRLANECMKRYKAVDAGLLKIMSKMGISVILAYRGGYNFEALGLSRALVADYFPGMNSRISGLGLAGLEENARSATKWHLTTMSSRCPLAASTAYAANGEPHALEGQLIHTLQTACNRRVHSVYKQICGCAAQARRPIQPARSAGLQTQSSASAAYEVQSINEIRKRFVTPGMSLGALSPEAHGTLNVAMNRIGAKSVSGEGGEDRAR